MRLFIKNDWLNVKMYQQFELSNGTYVKLNSQDLTRLNEVLSQASIEVSKLESLTSQPNLEFLTLNAGITTAQLFLNQELPTAELTLCGFSVHPIRSLAYYAVGGFYAGIKSASDGQKLVFESTQVYFRDVFLLQEAIALEELRDEPDEGYLANLKEVLEKMAIPFPEIVTAQTIAYEELCLNDPKLN